MIFYQPLSPCQFFFLNFIKPATGHLSTYAAYRCNVHWFLDITREVYDFSCCHSRGAAIIYMPILFYRFPQTVISTLGRQESIELPTTPALNAGLIETLDGDRLLKSPMMLSAARVKNTIKANQFPMPSMRYAALIITTSALPRHFLARTNHKTFLSHARSMYA